MNWDDLRYVLALVRHRTASEAARRLGVARTTVGRRVQALEAALGVRLFDVLPEGMVPTAAGQDLARLAEEVEASVLAAEARIGGRDTALSGNLRVATVDFLYECLAELFTTFSAAHPGIELSVFGGDEAVSLRRRQADVAIRLQDAPTDTLVGRRLAEVEFRIYASRTLLESAERGPGELPWLRFEGVDDARGLDDWYSRHAPDAPVALRFDSYAVMRRAVLAGVGVHFLPRMDAARFPDLVDIGPEGPGPTRTLWALTLPDLRTTSRVRAFLDHVYAAIGEGL